MRGSPVCTVSAKPIQQRHNISVKSEEIIFTPTLQFSFLRQSMAMPAGHSSAETSSERIPYKIPCPSRRFLFRGARL